MTDSFEAIAVVGFSIKFPQDATSEDALWKILMEKRNTATVIPKSRMNTDSMYHPDPNRRGQVDSFFA
jgi:acyl transferase domain-containing protein